MKGWSGRLSLVRIKPYTTFVAIKNGMHQAEGFAFFTPGVAKLRATDCEVLTSLTPRLLLRTRIESFDKTTDSVMAKTATN